MRYKEFNNNKVLERCISLFWENGYNGTPISSLVNDTGVNRFSLYHEFENKEGILYSALELYKVRYSSELLNMLDNNSNVENSLKKFFFGFTKRTKKPVGCFIIYISTELGDDNLRISAFLKTYLKEMELKFTSLLKSSPIYSQQYEVIASNLVLLFCNAMCHCYIQSEDESQSFISLNLDVILNK
jgi:AcrR family transcriptional regulator